ncbi:dTMP kinase [Beduini massiliensis]|uniref:dTMP kinase n=1 Tax=Beduini massiliensis TaxID=1585974 RepID=UPI00059AA14F|nr:dTMP kinase [Beduini massiliensis]
MAGLFITFEGPDGSGKTTIAALVAEALKNKGIDVVLTREPGGIEIAEQIRKIILDPKNTAMDERTEALLYAAARRQHLIEKVLPALKENKIVICDRFVDSSLVYQGVGRGIGIDKVYEMNLFAIEGIMPDFTVFFDIDPKLGLERTKKDDNRTLDRLDLEDISFHQKVYDGYMEVVERFKERIICIDASQSIEEVKRDVMNLIEDHIQ